MDVGEPAAQRDVSEAPRPASLRFLATAALSIAAFSVGLWLLPVDSDGAFAINDGIHYASGAELGKGSIIARHPLFHAIVWWVTNRLRDFGFEHPGHIAIRIVAGVGAAWLVVQLTLLAGRARWVAGWLCACFALSCRFVLLDSAAGETVVIATAASLLAFTLAARPQPRWVAVAAAFVLAMLFRQDNVIAAPGMALLMWPRLPKEKRLLRMAAFFLVTGAATLGLYLLLWRLNGIDNAFADWLFDASRTGQWGIGLTTERMLTHLLSLGDSTVGAIWGWSNPQYWVGPTVLGAVLLSGFLLRGGQSAARFAAAMLLTVVIRFFFHSWWAPVPQFHVYNIGAVAAAAAFAARADSGFLPVRARAGVALLTVMLLVTLLCHWPSTLVLRKRRLMEAVGYAGTIAPPETHFMCRGTAAATALGFAGIKSTQMPSDWQGMTRMVLEATQEGRPLLVFVDRFTVGNNPDALLRPGRYDNEIDELAPHPNARFVRIDGLVVAILFSLK